MDSLYKIFMEMPGPQGVLKRLDEAGFEKRFVWRVVICSRHSSLVFNVGELYSMTFLKGRKIAAVPDFAINPHNVDLSKENIITDINVGMSLKKLSSYVYLGQRHKAGSGV